MQLQIIQKKIYEIRGQKVMLDFDLAELYDTETKRLKEAVRRNIKRFPPDFMFELTRDEYNSLRTQNATLEKGKGRHSKFNPFAFTEHGVAMLSGILSSDKAIDVNISIMRAFTSLRQFVLTYKEIAGKLKKMERKYNRQFADVYEALNYLTDEKQKREDWENRKQIGYKK